VLGWSNEAKIAALAKQERDLATRILAHGAQIRALKEEVGEWNRAHGLWEKLAVFANFAELDWKPLVAAIDRLENERRELAASSDLLRTLQEQLRELAEAQAALEADYETASRAQATWRRSCASHARRAPSARSWPAPPVRTCAPPCFRPWPCCARRRWENIR
jgi:uncharacterized protein YPO0396